MCTTEKRARSIEREREEGHTKSNNLLWRYFLNHKQLNSFNRIAVTGLLTLIQHSHQEIPINGFSDKRREKRIETKTPTRRRGCVCGCVISSRLVTTERIFNLGRITPKTPVTKERENSHSKLLRSLSSLKYRLERALTSRNCSYVVEL